MSETQQTRFEVGPESTRGVHIVHLDDLPWSMPAPRAGRDPEATRSSGVLEKWVVRPAPDDDRFPVSVIRFPPGYVFPSHWHTEGEFILILRGSATVGDRQIGIGGMAYTDARTIYGAEAAGPDGCDFLMIRRARARNTVVATPAEVTVAERDGIVNSLNKIAPDLSARGVHVLNPATAEPEPDAASGTQIRWLMPPDPAGDRPPVGVADLAAHTSRYWDGNRFGQYLFVLDGEIAYSGDHIGPDGGVYVDAPQGVTLSSGDAGARVLLVRPITAPVHSLPPDDGR
jgi:hypothetical protein